MVQSSILILDDEPRIRETLADYFVDIGCLVVTANRTAEALRELHEHQFTLAVVDVRLPGNDRLIFINRARAIQPHLRYIIHTGSLECLAECGLHQAHGDVEAVFIKPVTDMNRFHDVLKRLQGKRRT